MRSPVADLGGVRQVSNGNPALTVKRVFYRHHQRRAKFAAPTYLGDPHSHPENVNGI